MRDPQGFYNGGARPSGNHGRFGWDRLSPDNGPSRLAKRNDSTDSSFGRRGTGSVAITYHRPKWFAYRITIVAISSGVSLTGLSLFLAQCMRNVL